MKRQIEDGAVRGKHEKLPGNKRVNCPHCGNGMKQKHLDHHVKIHHPNAVQVEAVELVAS